MTILNDTNLFSVAVKAGFLPSYASDSAFVTGKGSSATESDRYWNTTSKVVREHDGSGWRNLGGNPDIEHFTTTDDILIADEQGKTCTNKGATGDIAINLPISAGVGSIFTFILMADQEFKIFVQEGEKIWHGGGTENYGPAIYADNISDAVSLIKIDSDGWAFNSLTGNWTYDNHSDTYGMNGGGYTGSAWNDTIDYHNVEIMIGNTTDKGDISVSRYGMGGVRGSTYTFFGGGLDSGSVNSNVIDYVNRTTTSGDASDKGDLTVARRYVYGVFGSTYGFFAGGIGTGNSNVIDYIDVTTTSGSASDKGDLLATVYHVSGVSGNSLGIFGGANGESNVLQYIDSTTTSGNAVDRGDLSSGRANAVGLSGSTYGYYCGGYGPSATDIIDYVTYVTTSTNAVDRGDLTVARYAAGRADGSEYGFCVGGSVSGSASNAIDYLDNALTAGNAADRGDITVARYYLDGA